MLVLMLGDGDRVTFASAGRAHFSADLDDFVDLVFA